MTDKFLLFDLDDEKSKDVATLLSNESARKILSHLSEHAGAETDIAKDLNIPLSTVHYNVQNLYKHKLIIIKDTLYSQKGNKVQIYAAARKAIILAPKGSSFFDTLKAPLAIIGLAGIASLIINYVTRPVEQSLMMAAPAPEAAAKLAMAADTAAGTAPSIAPTVATDYNIALWFFLGAVFVAILSFAYNYWRMKK